jgi:hypothetical protein
VTRPIVHRVARPRAIPQQGAPAHARLTRERPTLRVASWSARASAASGGWSCHGRARDARILAAWSARCDLPSAVEPRQARIVAPLGRGAPRGAPAPDGIARSSSSLGTARPPAPCSRRAPRRCPRTRCNVVSQHDRARPGLLQGAEPPAPPFQYHVGASPVSAAPRSRHSVFGALNREIGQSPRRSKQLRRCATPPPVARARPRKRRHVCAPTA